MEINGNAPVDCLPAPLNDYVQSAGTSPRHQDELGSATVRPTNMVIHGYSRVLTLALTLTLEWTQTPS